MNHYMFYWRPDSLRGGLLHHAAGAQLEKLDKGDHLWITTFEDQKLILFGHMVVDRVVTPTEAQGRLGTKDIWPAPWHALANLEKSEPMIDVDVTKHARRLRFQGIKDRLPRHFSGLNLQTMRLLSDDTATLFNKIWEENVDLSETSRELARLTGELEYAEPFDPQNILDARERILREIVNRRGQFRFRNSLLNAYSRRCAISASDAVETLEPAHIIPFKGTHTNHVSNGLLLRTDLHTLFDLHLIAIDPSDLKVRVAKRLKKTHYGRYAGKKIRLPRANKVRPSMVALGDHFQKAKGQMT